MNNIEHVRLEISPLRDKLLSHPVYKAIKTPDDLKVFLQHHIFAVWDFMSLLKALQKDLTCVSVPWVPQGNPVARRLINEIVMGEEADEDEHGVPMSHYELYLAAMSKCGADTAQVESLITQIKAGRRVQVAVDNLDIPDSVKRFVLYTFEVIETGELHKIAAAFTYGREDLIPDMFTSLVNDLSKSFPDQLDKLVFYLDRHIELDQDTHGPMANKMIEELCGNDEQKWKDCIATSKMALQKRVELWDGILNEIRK
ncbi:DUF3050 domain-containing protein [Cytophagaceae bacterium ABcell3]|nr:DUF3050 domain-containing protein [Cytophagaceae bacterium ABcell3]